MQIEQSSSKKKQFDELAREAAEILLQQFWILREHEPEKYQLIREREHALRNYFLDKLGYRLIVHRFFAKLEKIPVQPEAWMGIAAFKSYRDYVFFCCVLAFLESKGVDEQFLLSELCTDLSSLYPGDEGVNWSDYEQRKSLIRVVQFVTSQHLIRAIDGDVEAFSAYEQSEVLYEVQVFARYFVRSHPKDLQMFTSAADVLGAEADLTRRQRVYRQLFLSPVMYSQGQLDEDFQYLRVYRNRVRDDIERHTDFQFELYRNAALLTIQENKQRYNLFPDNRAISDLVLHFASLVRSKLAEKTVQTLTDGRLCLSVLEFEQWVKQCQQAYASGWSKHYREASLKQLVKDLLEEMLAWKMVEVEQDVIFIMPALARVVGEYPADFEVEPSE